MADIHTHPDTGGGTFSAEDSAFLATQANAAGGSYSPTSFIGIFNVMTAAQKEAWAFIIAQLKLLAD